MLTRFARLSLTAGSVAALAITPLSQALPAPAMAQPVTIAARAPATPASPPEEPIRSSSYHLAQVREVTTYRPTGPIKGVAIFLSGDSGWNLGVVDMAKALADQGIAVAGISTPDLQKSLDGNAERCVNPNFALQALAQDFEHRLALPGYIKPVLVGYSSGATIAYAALAQAPGGTWRGAVSLGFGPDIGGSKTWCAIPGVTVSRITKPEAGWLFSAAPHLPAPWLVLQGMQDQVVSPAVTKAFTAGVPQAQLIELPKVGHGYSVQANWMPQFKAAFDRLIEPQAAAHIPAPALASVADLPLTIVADPAARHSDVMAVMYSGDGGWAGIDRELAARLAAAGVPVVGVDSLSYFWNARTPAQTGQDAARIVEHFSREWHRSKVIFVGLFLRRGRPGLYRRQSSPRNPADGHPAEHAGAERYRRLPVPPRVLARHLGRQDPAHGARDQAAARHADAMPARRGGEAQRLPVAARRAGRTGGAAGRPSFR